MGSAVGSCLALACLSAPLIGPSADGAAPEQVVLRLADRSWGLRIAPPGFEWGAAQSARNGTAV
ncbi:MAG TPA: hypothetical protein VD788_06385, partial [Candidatus Polarisedimenticolaceae bacterium]|nr:hypothetical protein [Candidatus Polarisedimenticolaceae bacterium]